MSKPNIEDIYQLSPGQHGMLTVVLLAGSGSDLYFDQSTLTLGGELDEAAWHRAWQRVVDRHPSLRTLFVWERQGGPPPSPAPALRGGRAGRAAPGGPPAGGAPLAGARLARPASARARGAAGGLPERGPRPRRRPGHAAPDALRADPLGGADLEDGLELPPPDRRRLVAPPRA